MVEDRSVVSWVLVFACTETLSVRLGGKGGQH
jgi:hypothetical protein